VKFKKDILIIYSEEDGTSNKEWTDDFRNALEAYLNHLLRKQISISVLSASEVKSENDLTDFAVTIPIITEGFTESNASIFALEEFIEQSKNDIKTDLKGYDRIFIIARQEFDRNLMPAKIIENHLYKFYRRDLLTEEIQSFRPVNPDNPAKDQKFWFKLTDLVNDLNDVLSRIHSMGMTGGSERLDQIKTVYLAETAEDLEYERDYLRRDLIRHGYRVLPEKSLDSNEKIMEERIRKDIEKADISIHMIGNEYGRIPEGGEISIVELQNNLATEYSNQVINQVLDDNNARKFHKLLWICADPQEMTMRQKNYIDGVLKQAEAMRDTEILDVPIEELRQTVRKKLKFGHREVIGRILPDESQASRQKSVYIIADPGKENHVSNLKGILEKEGFATSLTPHEGDIVGLIKQHQKRIRECDATIILYEDENPSWLDSKIKDLVKAPGLGKNTPTVVNGLVNLGKSEINNKHLDQARMVLISNPDSIGSNDLGPFFEKFHKAQ
jgi:hypothetical protein